MTLKELLNVVHPDTRVQVCIRLFGSVFKTTRYQKHFLQDEKATELLQRKVKTARVILEDEETLMQIVLE